ncbi:MAG TPA: ThiF family adenylyltransferase [Halomicronema sp.]
MSIFFHEQLYRTPQLMAKIKELPITICGVGALGANLTENLARTGFANLKIIDRDRIEDRNLSTQPYYRSDIGAFKAKILSNSLYRALGLKIEAQTKELNAENAALLIGKPTLVIDTFDNSISRQIVKEYCLETNLNCLHIGLATDYAEIIWNQNYRIPSPINDDVCDYPLARNIVLLAVAVASEIILKFAHQGTQNSLTITLDDFTIQPF